MTEKRIKYAEFCVIIIDILEEQNGISTRVLSYLYKEKIGSPHLKKIRPKLHRMRKEGLIQTTYSVKGYRWWNNHDEIILKPNEVIVDD